MTGLTVTRLMGWWLKMQTSSGVQTSDKLFGSIYGAWHVSFFGWFLSRIEASLHLLCTFPIKTTPFSSHFSTFRRNTLLEHVRHNCQRLVRSIPAAFVLIRSLFGSVSNFFLFLLFFYLSFSFWNPLFSFLCPHHLSKPVSLRFCHYMQAMSSASSNQTFVCDEAGYEKVYPSCYRDLDDLSEERSLSASSLS